MNLCSQGDLTKVRLYMGDHLIKIAGYITSVSIKGAVVVNLKNGKIKCIMKFKIFINVQFENIYQITLICIFCLDGIELQLPEAHNFSNFISSDTSLSLTISSSSFKWNPPACWLPGTLAVPDVTLESFYDKVHEIIFILAIYHNLIVRVAFFQKMLWYSTDPQTLVQLVLHTQ